MKQDRLHITQGERAVGTREDDIISTNFGSCVSCCLWDPVARVGGMNHMSLTVSAGQSGPCDLSSINAMELLINDILKLGTRRDRLRAKAFGGARMLAGISDIGRANCEFTLQHLEKERIACDGKSFGGGSARHVMFWPTTGRVLLKIRTDDVLTKETPVQKQGTGNDLEFF